MAFEADPDTARHPGGCAPAVVEVGHGPLLRRGKRAATAEPRAHAAAAPTGADTAAAVTARAAQPFGTTRVTT